MNIESVKIYCTFFIIYLLIDLIWIYGAKKMHVQMIEKVQKEPVKFNIVAASMFYLMAPLAYCIFIKPYACDLKTAIKLSISIAGLMYGSFDLTNKTIFKDYSWSYTFADISWGMFNMTLTTIIIYMLHC